MKPIIGVLAEVDTELVCKVNNAYINAIEKSGGVPVLLPYVQDKATLDAFVTKCDGFFFTGGADVAPSRYGEEIKDTCGVIQYRRDELDFAMLERVLDSRKPILAVCRGAQLVNVALGGTLYQDIPTEVDTNTVHRQSEPKNVFSHSVRTVENTPLSTLLGMETIPVNSFHHQAIKMLGNGLEVMALADDGIIEAVYRTGTQYLRAYQWHPEGLFENDIYSRLIFSDFIKACVECLD